MATKILLIVIISFLSITGIGEIVSGVKSKKWSYVEGKIIQSKVVSEQSSYDNNSFAKPKIIYSYEIENRKHEGKRIYFGQQKFSFGFSFFAKRLIKKYPLGKPVKVYYQPNKETTSVLEPGVKMISLLKIALSIIIVVVLVNNTGKALQ